MSRDNVIRLGREPVARRRHGGLLGLGWRVRTDPDTRVPYLEGFHPDRPAVPVARLKVQALPRYATPGDLMAGALLWSDYDEGAAALMAADLERENATDD